VGVTADGQREVLGLDVVSGEDGAGWLAFLRSLGPFVGLLGSAGSWSAASPGCALSNASAPATNAGFLRESSFGCAFVVALSYGAI
jgi:hypothetical protein